MKDQLIYEKLKEHDKSIYYINPTYIKELIESKLNINLANKTRQRPYPYYRMIYYKLCKDFTKFSLSQIGIHLSPKDKFDHATVLHGINKFEQHKDQTWFVDFYNLYQALSMEIYRNFKGNNLENEFISIDHAKHHYKLKFIELVDKYRSVINNQLKVINNLKNDAMINQIAELDDASLELLRPRIEAFFKMNKIKKYEN